MCYKVPRKFVTFDLFPLKLQVIECGTKKFAMHRMQSEQALINATFNLSEWQSWP